MIDKDLFKLLGKDKKYIFISVALMILGLVLNLIFTASLCAIIYYKSTDNDAYLYFIISAIVSIILRFIVSKVNSDITDLLGRRVKKEMREKIYNKILSLGLKSIDGINMAGLTQISMEGVEQLDTYYTLYIPQFFYAMIAPFVLFFSTVFLYWRSAVCLICFVPLIPVSIILVSKYAKKVFAKYWDKYISMGDGFLDATSGLKDLKIFEADEYYNKKMNKNAEEFRKITMKVLVMQLASVTIMDLVAYAGAGCGIALAILGLYRGYETNFAIILFVVLTAVEFFLPMRAFGSAFHIGMNGASSGRKILKLLETKEDNFGDKNIDDTTISLKDVTFSYDDKRDVIKDVNITFTPGLNSIVGKSGCGKSTIINLILGSITPKEGEVRVGKCRLKDISKKNYYSHISKVSSNTYIFNESIRNNFKLAKEDVTDEEIYEALKKVNLYDFVLSIGGLDYVILEDSENISGGERQRLALAINLVIPKDIYIFDEATSNIDTESEAIILNNIKELAKEKTVIFISHRLFNVIDSNVIYFMEDGVIKEMGRHDELMRLKGGYFNLFQTQHNLEEGYKVMI